MSGFDFFFTEKNKLPTNVPNTRYPPSRKGKGGYLQAVRARGATCIYIGT